MGETNLEWAATAEGVGKTNLEWAATCRRDPALAADLGVVAMLELSTANVRAILLAVLPLPRFTALTPHAPLPWQV